MNMSKAQTTPRELRVHLTLKSRNEKTGPIPVSTTTAATCPTACPLQANGCYADAGPLALFWRPVTEKTAGTTWRQFVKAIAQLPTGTLWRHNQAGDLPGNRVQIDAERLAQLVDANKGKRGFTYTHYSPSPANVKAIAAANQSGFTINLSANNPAHADRLASLDVAPVVTVLPASVDGSVTRTVTTPGGRTIAICPATYLETSCADCGLCAVRDRKVIVGFPAHGASKRKAETVAMGVK
jgi:hypothetical protein